MAPDVPTPDAHSPSPAQDTATLKRKHPNAAHTHTTHTLRAPQWTYLHLTLHTSPPPSSPSPLDAITARQHLTAALNQFLGLTGTAIPVDLLKIAGRDVWIRVPREDGSAVVAAVSGWMGAGGTVGWRVKARGQWLGVLVGGDGSDLFEN